MEFTNFFLPPFLLSFREGKDGKGEDLFECGVGAKGTDLPSFFPPFFSLSISLSAKEGKGEREDMCSGVS